MWGVTAEQIEHVGQAVAAESRYAAKYGDQVRAVERIAWQLAGQGDEAGCIWLPSQLFTLIASMHWLLEYVMKVEAEAGHAG